MRLLFQHPLLLLLASPPSQCADHQHRQSTLNLFPRAFFRNRRPGQNDAIHPHLSAFNKYSTDDDGTDENLSSNDSICPKKEEKALKFWTKKSNETTIPDDKKRYQEHDEEHNHNPAIHQIEHRAKEKTSFFLSEKLAERQIEHAAGRTAEHLSEKTGGRILTRAAARKQGRVLESASERAGEKMMARTAEHVGERTMERTGDNLLKQAWKGVSSLIYRGTNRGAERAWERSGSKAIERGIEHAGKSAAEHTGERFFKRSGSKAVERGLEHAGNSMAGHSGERLLERSGTRAAERGLEHAGESGIKIAGKLERIFGLSLEKVALRFGRGLLITLPALGGIFALYLLKSDIERLREEWAHRIKTSSACFLGAGIVDGLDSILHFVIAYGLLTHLSHHYLKKAEAWSLRCAVISTVAAVIGEVLSLKILKQRESSSGTDGDIPEETLFPGVSPQDVRS
jgi:hypothetical protein